jgi:hypothetical protein
MIASLRAPVLPYKSGLIHSLLTSVKLKQKFEQGSIRDKKCPVFTGEHGIEALLYIEERLRKIASRTLLWSTGLKLFDGSE